MRVKHTAAVAILSLVIGVPVAAQVRSSGAAGVKRPGVAKIARFFRTRIRQGVRQGQITPQELASLRADITAFRAKAQAMRSAGTPLTSEQRTELRQGLRQIRREIFKARR